MIKVEKDFELSNALDNREKDIVVIGGLAEELYDKLSSEDPRIYGALSRTVFIPDLMINQYFGSIDLFNMFVHIVDNYNIGYNMDESKVYLSIIENK
ncbi:hypothetical protein [Peptoniphilus stercorisuis]|uniref:Uncharacterized protein n=1 Tax=Peptoniphilus stercorisuis TaxID=1436965 RepID=A0ABS4KD94_9FIRM|nr:hypothetical protein [Peptoniphilus stercorisuis]MBP2025751.1 hypothetical protein [Peptoniphilus stercorisuis]